MNSQDLKYFIAVYESRSFTRAADTLHTVQSNVSVRIHDLESWLGGPLFRRRWHEVVPTAKGEELYLHAKEVIAALDETERSLKHPEDGEEIIA